MSSSSTLSSPASFTISLPDDKESEEFLNPFQRKSPRWNRRRFPWIRMVLGLAMILLLLTYLTKPKIPSSSHKKDKLSFQKNAPYWDPQIPSKHFWNSLSNINDDIPNIAHFVRQINRDKDYNPVAPFKVEFRHLMSYYSCHHYLHPERIYFWTDTPQEMLDDARMNGDIFTKALFRIPNLEIRSVIFPNVTQKGVQIKEYAHRSDFVRTRVMAKMGGQYFDDDSWVLRDLKTLRKSGFENIFSLDLGARIAQAAWLCKPMNPLMLAFAELQETFFNGDWLRASNDLVTALMVHFSRQPGGHSSITLEKDAFFQGVWFGDGLNRYYEVHDFDPFFKEPDFVQGEVAQTFAMDLDWGWRMDWRRSWIVHGFSNQVRAEKAEWMFKEYKGFTPAYILSRRSNIARALYPALRHMLDEKFLELSPEELMAPVS